jgi:hypothetical protein
MYSHEPGIADVISTLTKQRRRNSANKFLLMMLLAHTCGAALG